MFAAAAAVLIGGCGRNDSPSGSVAFWQFWTSPEVRPVVVAMTDSFVATYKIPVQLGDLTWADGHEKIAIALAGGSGPDVLELGSDWVAEFAAGGRLLDLTPHLGGLRDSLLMWEPAELRGGTYGVPWMLGTRVLFCNRTLLTQAGYSADFEPRTWAELLNAAEKVNALGDGTFGFGSNAAERHRLYKKFLPFFWSAGGEVFDQTLTKTMFASPAGRESLEYYLKLSATGLIELQTRLDEYFAAGKVGFVISGEWLIRRLTNGALSFDYFVCTMPAIDSSGVGYSFSGGEYLAINHDSKRADVAMAFIRHLVQPANDRRFATATGSFTPVNRFSSAGADSPLTRTAEVFRRQLQNSRSTPVHPRWVAIEEILERGLEQAIYGKLSAAEALALIDRECAQALSGHETP